MNNVPEVYHIAINILESQEQLILMIIINRLLEESRKMRGNISESSGKMKMTLLSNTTKPGKSRKPVRKTDESKTNAKKNLHYNFYNKNSHEE